MTYIIIFVTAVVSVLCFRNRAIFDRLALDPWMVWHRRQWDRVLTHAFVHGDTTHLLVNMLVFWSFGLNVEEIFKIQARAGMLWSGTLAFLLLYFGGVVAASAYDVIKRRDALDFKSVGASGAVSAVIFCSIFFGPMEMIYFFGVIPMPGIVFGALYMLYEYYMTRRQGDHINHYAHLLGAAYGFIFPLLTDPSQIRIFLAGFHL